MNNKNENIINPCFLFRTKEYWELRISGYTFQYVHSRPSGWYNNHAYVAHEKYDLVGCEKITAKEAVLMMLDVLEKNAVFNTDSQRDMWELAAVMLTK